MSRKRYSGDLFDDDLLPSGSGSSSTRDPFGGSRGPFGDGDLCPTPSKSGVPAAGRNNNNNRDLPVEKPKNRSEYPARRDSGQDFPATNSGNRNGADSSGYVDVYGQAVTATGEKVYVVKAVIPVNLGNETFFNKLTSGYPIFANYMYKLSLVDENVSAHNTRGTSLDGIVIGYIDSVALNVQSRVMVKGSYKKGLFFVSELYNVDTGEKVHINKLYSAKDRDDIRGGRGGRSGGIGGLLLGLGIIAVLIAVLLSVLPASAVAAKIGGYAKIAIVFLLGFLYLKVTNFQVLRNPMVALVMGIVIAYLLCQWIPGLSGLFEKIITIVIIVLGIRLMIKSVWK